jgi:hypothetical protein
MGGYNRSFLNNASITDSDDEMSSVVHSSSDVLYDSASHRWPAEIFLVLHNHSQRASVDRRYTNYAPKTVSTKTNIISVHYSYEHAVASASRHTQEIFDLDEEDMEWLVLLDWDGM